MRDVFQLFVLKCGLAVLGVIALTGVYWIVMPRLLRLFRWLSRLGMVGAVVVGLGLTVAIDYAGEKNDSTNNPAPPTGDTPAQVESIWVDPTSCPSRVEPWYLRGAWKDSRIVVFDEGWCFPFAFGHLASVELGSQGCVFTSEQAEHPFAELAIPLALAPGETEVRHGRTSRNSYRFEWVNAHPNRDASVTANASIELFRNGDFETTEGGITTRHSYEIPFPHDGFGQDDIWVCANFTNGAEIVSAGYADWVDDQIGINLTNGLYKFTATFLSDPPEPTWLQVGDYSVAVTNAGDYAFVLEKGRSYDFGTWPHVEDVAYDMQDDLYGRGPLLMSALPHDDTQGRWTVDGGWHWLYLPYGDDWGSVGWLPTLRGSPDVAGFSADDFPKTFTAIVEEIMEVQISGQPRYYNPAYVAAGLNGRYRVDVMPSVPSSEIKWYVYDGEAQFPQGNTGSQVEITGQSGECEISIYVLGQSDERMRFLTEFVE